jgi:RHS repeat-associated protein
MGARPYDPQIGRFYSPDPVDGGSCNEYDYACQEPVNGFDLEAFDQLIATTA